MKNKIMHFIIASIPLILLLVNIYIYYIFLTEPLRSYYGGTWLGLLHIDLHIDKFICYYPRNIYARIFCVVVFIYVIVCSIIYIYKKNTLFSILNNISILLLMIFICYYWYFLSIEYRMR